MDEEKGRRISYNIAFLIFLVGASMFITISIYNLRDDFYSERLRNASFLVYSSLGVIFAIFSILLLFMLHRLGRKEENGKILSLGKDSVLSGPARIAVFILFIIVIADLGMLVLLERERALEREDKYNHVYVIDIERTSDHDLGLEMIDIAESFDYGALYNTSPRSEGLTPTFKPTEDRANYVSRDNLDFYSDHINDLENDHTYGHYTMEYKAEADKASSVELWLRSRDDFEGKRTGLYFNGRSIPFSTFVHHGLIFFNGTGMERVDLESGYPGDRSLSLLWDNCYVIEMEWDYSAKPEPDEGGGFWLHQYVVVNEDGELLASFTNRIDVGVWTYGQ